MAIKVFADGANLEGMLDMYENGNVQGFTTNPSLMKKGGVTDYRAFAKEVLAHITDVSVSFEVFADDVETMEVEAREIATWADNVYVKIPCVTTKGESTAELVRKLSADGIKVNVTTIFTPTQVDEMVEAVDAETPSIISLFAGRIADTGVDPIPFMTESVKKAAAKPNCEVLWASTRELINIYQAEGCGCQIITVPNSILAKRKNIGRDPYEVSLDTVRGFAKDIASLGFHILPWTKVPPPAPCKIESIQQGKGFYQLGEAWNSPRFGSDDAKTGAVSCFFVSEGHPERWNLQNTRDFARRERGDPCFGRFTRTARAQIGAVSLMWRRLFVVDGKGARRKRGDAHTDFFAFGTCCATSLVALGLALTCGRKTKGRENPMFCPKCGTKNVDEAKFCCACGNPFPTASVTPPSAKPVSRL